MKLLLVLMLSLNSFGSMKIVQTATKDHLKLIEAVDNKYIKANSIQMAVERQDKIMALDKEKKFEGDLWLKKGKLRLELTSQDESKDESLVVIDGKYIWLVSPPPKEFKKAKTQVIRASMTTPHAQSRGLLKILNQGGVLKFFKVYGVYPSKGKITYYLNPMKKSLELKKASLVVDRKSQTINSLSYVDVTGNETKFVFSNMKFNQSIDKKLLSYTPPKNADVMKY